MSLIPRWSRHGDGLHVLPGAVVKPDERLAWPLTIGIGAQHVIAMFGATFLVPLLTGLPPTTTLFFTGIGTMLFLLVTAGRIPSYLGSSFAFIGPITAVTASHGVRAAFGGIVLAGLTLFLVGLAVHVFGHHWVQKLMPPAVTGAIVALIGFNLAPTTKNTIQGWMNAAGDAWTGAGPAPEGYVFHDYLATALVTVLAVAVVTVAFRGVLGRLAILIGVLCGYVAAALQGEVRFEQVRAADWVGLPEFSSPTFSLGVVGLFIPVVLVLVAENIGHVKTVAAMTGEDLDPSIGKALMADGLATTLAGSGGGAGTTTYAENIGVMAATKVYSTAAYWVAAVIAVLLSFLPKFGALINTIPGGVLGGAGLVLYGMIGMLGVRIWVQNHVNFANPINLTAAAVGLTIAIADITWKAGDLTFNGIALGSFAVLAIYHGMRAINRRTHAVTDHFDHDDSRPASKLG